MALSFLFRFDDLPLLIDLGFEAGLVNGEAEIKYTRDVSDFSVQDIWLDGYKVVPDISRPLEKLVPVDGWLEMSIRNRLENEWAERVMEAIRDEIEAERQYRFEDAAYYRRETRLELVR